MLTTFAIGDAFGYRSSFVGVPDRCILSGRRCHLLRDNVISPVRLSLYKMLYWRY